MLSRFKNKYRIESNRLKDFDYTGAWWYYVTICVKDHQSVFGKIIDGKIKHNLLGINAKTIWKDIPKHYINSDLDEFVVMPNHIHGILIINDSYVETGHAPSLQHSLGNIVGSYKSAVSKWAHENNYPNFLWQVNYYDHIIRNQKDLDRIRKYIQLNPLKWELDKYYREK